MRPDTISSLAQHYHFHLSVEAMHEDRGGWEEAAEINNAHLSSPLRLRRSTQMIVIGAVITSRVFKLVRVYGTTSPPAIKTLTAKVA